MNIASNKGLKSCVNIWDPDTSEAEIAEANIRRELACEENELHLCATQIISNNDNPAASTLMKRVLSHLHATAKTSPWIVGISTPEPYETFCGLLPIEKRNLP